MTHYVALVTDLTGRYANVLVQANTWDQAIDQLEDAGCEVIENQSEDYEEYGIGNGLLPLIEELKEVDVIPINELTTHSDFVVHN
jgi:hypothetical protein